MEKCPKCATALEEQNDSCVCNESLCIKCCECDKACGCECDVK